MKYHILAVPVNDTLRIFFSNFKHTYVVYGSLNGFLELEELDLARRLYNFIIVVVLDSENKKQ